LIEDSGSFELVCLWLKLLLLEPPKLDTEDVGDIFNVDEGVLLLKLTEVDIIGVLTLLDLEYFRLFDDDGVISDTGNVLDFLTPENRFLLEGPKPFSFVFNAGVATIVGVILLFIVAAPKLSVDFFFG
jgi:hypothetical protein